MLRQIISPLGALFTLELPGEVHYYLTDTDEQERAERIKYMERITNGNTEPAGKTDKNNIQKEH